MSASSQRIETAASDTSTNSQHHQPAAVDVRKLLGEAHRLCLQRGTHDDIHLPSLTIDVRESYHAYLHAKDDYASGDYQQALSDIDNAIAHNSSSSIIGLERGLIEDQLGNFALTRGAGDQTTQTHNASSTPEIGFASPLQLQMTNRRPASN
jgi:hypothetical protein